MQTKEIKYRLQKIVYDAILLGIECKDALNPNTSDLSIKEMNEKISNFVEKNSDMLNYEQLCAIILFSSMYIDPSDTENLDTDDFISNISQYMKTCPELSYSMCHQTINILTLLFDTDNIMYNAKLTPVEPKNESRIHKDYDDDVISNIAEFIKSNTLPSAVASIPVSKFCDAYKLYYNVSIDNDTFVNIISDVLGMEVNDDKIAHCRLSKSGRILVNFILPASKTSEGLYEKTDN